MTLSLNRLLPWRPTMVFLPVLGQRGSEPLRPELVQQPRRAFDVGEQKGDGAGRELSH